MVGTYTVCVLTLLGVFDLQAYTSNMTMHNGKFGCISYEEPGVIVKQGKWHPRCYPYTPVDDKPDKRHQRM